MIDYEWNFDNNIDDVNKKANHSIDNDKDNMQYIMVVYLLNESIMHFLMAQDIFPSNKDNIAQYFVFN